MSHPRQTLAGKTWAAPRYVRHETFDLPTARKDYNPQHVLDDSTDFTDSHMPDDVTRDHARRMHFAAHKIAKARTKEDAAKWRAAYFALRDRIVLGNRKLVYRAVRRRMAFSNATDDSIGDCHIVLIQAVAAYNPWLGVRFSTYAYTCLIRALSRKSQRLATDCLSRCASLDQLPDGEPGGPAPFEPGSSARFPIEQFLHTDHPLLSHREKVILSRRFCLGDDPADQTLEKVGESLGLSKERVRQVQASALGKLRQAIVTAAAAPTN